MTRVGINSLLRQRVSSNWAANSEHARTSFPRPMDRRRRLVTLSAPLFSAALAPRILTKPLGLSRGLNPTRRRRKSWWKGNSGEGLASSARDGPATWRDIDEDGSRNFATDG